jgi:hypothetical protein
MNLLHVLYCVLHSIYIIKGIGKALTIQWNLIEKQDFSFNAKEVI